ncbi:MAG TPA: CvpA family protein [Verrucomicrobiae bacterium]|nr:CvpA family protein [Verrucomicrobiae bacterium]
MTIWLLVIVLLACEFGLGLRQGGIRAAFSLGGILLGALLALPLGHLLERLLGITGIKHPLVLWLLPPAIAFFLILLIFKIAGYAVHRKVEVFYKYKTGDLRIALWERLNARLGVCVSFANGAAYLILISFVLYVAGYWSVQLATSPSTPKGLRLLNQFSKDLQATGMADVGRSIERMPPLYYQTADIAGLIYNNPSLKDRLYNYPPYVGLAERPDFESLVNSSDLAQQWQNQTPILELIKQPSVDSIIKNPETLKTFWDLILPDLSDLGTYLVSGRSPKYASQKIVGRWSFDPDATIGMLRKSRPNIPSKEMARLKSWIHQQFDKTVLVAMTDRQAVLKSFPHLKSSVTGTPAPTELLNVPARWADAAGRYALTYSPEGKEEAASLEIEGDRLTITGQGLELAFQRQD